MAETFGLSEVTADGFAVVIAMVGAAPATEGSYFSLSLDGGGFSFDGGGGEGGESAAPSGGDGGSAPAPSPE